MSNRAKCRDSTKVSGKMAGSNPSLSSNSGCRYGSLIYPLEGSCESSSQGVQLILFPFNWCRKRFWGFQIYGRWEAFLKFWKYFIPRRDSAKQSPMGSILILSILLWYEKGIWHFQFTGGNSQKKNMKMFYPPKGLCRAEPNGVHLIFFPFYCV